MKASKATTKTTTKTKKSKGGKASPGTKSGKASTKKAASAKTEAEAKQPGKFAITRSSVDVRVLKNTVPLRQSSDPNAGNKKSGSGSNKPELTSLKLSREEKAEYRQSLLERKEMLMGDVSHMHDEALKNVPPALQGINVTDEAEIGAEQYEQDLTLSLIQNEQEELEEIEAALERLKTNKFGICSECGCKIRKVRLRAIPWTTQCIDCKQDSEKRQF